MSGSVSHSSLLVVVFTAGTAFLLTACNGNGAPVGNPSQASTTSTQFQSSTNTNTNTGGGGSPINVGGLQATDNQLTAVLERMNTLRSQNGQLPPYSRDVALDQCANQLAVQLSQGGSPSGICGASQISAGSLQSGADLQASGISAVNQFVAEGTPPAPQQNDNTNILSPTFATVGIGLVANQGKTYIVILFR